MKKESIISIKKEGTALNFGIALFLALGVMLLMNALIGSMSGMPALVGFLCVYVFQKYFKIGEKENSEENVSRMIRIQMIQYGIGYLLIWAGMNVLVFLSRISGWGSIDGITVGAYIKQLLETTMMERWAYFFTGILMFTYIMSLYPLIVMKHRKVWGLYLVGDTGFFVLLCSGIAGLCQHFFEKENEKKRAKCVLDHLLMCQMDEKWQPVVFMVGIFLILILVMLVVYFISKASFGKEENQEKRILKKENILIPVVMAILLIAGGTGYFYFGYDRTGMAYHRVAESLTEDSCFGPMVYNGNIYLPVEEEAEWTEELVSLGYYRLALDVEEDALWKEKSIFLLWDEEWEKQSSYGGGFTGYTVCETEVLEALREAYPRVVYKEEEFKNYDAYFTIKGYDKMPDNLEEAETEGCWSGCILVKEDKFYFGSISNPITGELLLQLLDVLGGYENSQELISSQEFSTQGEK